MVDLACLLTEFAHTLVAERQVHEALMACPSISIGMTVGPKPNAKF